MRVKTLFAALFGLSLSACVARSSPTQNQKATDPPPYIKQCETDLFCLDDLRDVDLSPKNVLAYVTSIADDCDESRSLMIMRPVIRFYSQIGVQLKVVYADTIPLDILCHNCVGIRLVNTVTGGAGEARIEKRMCFAETKQHQDPLFLHPLSVTQLCARNPDYADETIAGVVAHELGHLFGLWHSERFSKDSIQDYVRPGLPNFMSYYLEPKFSPSAELGYGFTEFQHRQVHSYLSQGKVYRQVIASGNLEKYIQQVGVANYWERPSR